MSGPEMPIFTRTFDLLAWLLPVSNHFPRSHRHTLTRRALDSAFDLREHLERAHLRRGAERRVCLQDADASLACLRTYLRLLVRMQWLSEGQYLHAAGLVVDIGRLLGGWSRAVQQG